MGIFEHIMQMVGEFFLRAPKVAEVGADACEFLVEAIRQAEFAHSDDDIMSHDCGASGLVEVRFYFCCLDMVVQGFLFLLGLSRDVLRRQDQ